MLQTSYGGTGFEPEGGLDWNLGVFGAFVVALVAGLVTTLMWAGELRRIAAAPGWPKVDGHVSASGAYREGRGSPYHQVIADVQYIVNGAKYEVFAHEIERQVHEGDLGRVQPRRGQMIPVWYDPDDPARSTLTATWSSGCSFRFSVIVGCWSVAGILLPVLCWRFYRVTHGEFIGGE